MHMHAAYGLRVRHRPQELRMPEHEMWRDVAFGDQRLRTVDIAKKFIRKPRALRDGSFDPHPIGGSYDEGYDVELPRARVTAGLVIDVVSDAIVANHAAHRGDAGRIFLRCHLAEGVRDRLQRAAA